MSWIILLPAPTILGQVASSRLYSRPMRTAWTIWSGYAGPRALSARRAGTREVGGGETVGSSARGAVPVGRCPQALSSSRRVRRWRYGSTPAGYSPRQRRDVGADP